MNPGAVHLLRECPQQDDLVQVDLQHVYRLGTALEERTLEKLDAIRVDLGYPIARVWQPSNRFMITPRRCQLSY